MTFNIDNTADQPGDNQGQPSQQPVNQDNGSTGAVDGITPEQLSEILKRDEHAQRHISNLENENKQMRENFVSLQDQLSALQKQLASQQKVEELLARKPTSNDHQGNEDKTTMNTPTNSFDPEVIDSLVTQRMQDFMSKQEQEKNFRQVSTELSGIFKDKADEHVTAVASQNGLSFEDAMSLAKTNPVMFNNLFINPYKKNSTNTPAPTMGTQSTSSVPNQGSEITMEYWNKLRRENQAKFFSRDTQKAYHEWFHSQKQNSSK